jgi:hypothetical protein
MPALAPAERAAPRVAAPAPPRLAVEAGELIFEDVVVAVVVTVKFDDVPVDIAVSVELLDKQLIALGIVTPKSPQACRTYPVAVT